MLTEEVYATIQEIKNGKAVGVDEVPAEILKLLDGVALEKLEDLCKQIYETCNWPEDFTRIAMIPIPKRLMLLSVLTIEPSV